MSQATNIQAQLNRLRESLEPGKSSTPVPQPSTNFVPQDYTTVPQLGKPGNIMPLSAFAGGDPIIQGPPTGGKPNILKKYGKFVILGVVVIVLGVLFYKRRKAMIGKKKSGKSPSESVPGLSYGIGGPTGLESIQGLPGFPPGKPQQSQTNPFSQQRQLPPGFMRGPPHQQHSSHSDQQARQSHQPQHNQSHQSHQSQQFHQSHQPHQSHQSHRSHQSHHPPAPSAQVSDPNFTAL